MSNIHNRIKEERLRCGLSQGALARKIGVSRSAVSQWENENPSKGQSTAPDSENLLKLATFFKRSPHYLQSGEDDARNPKISDTFQKPKLRYVDWTVIDQYIKLGDHFATREDSAMYLIEENEIWGKNIISMRMAGDAMVPKDKITPDTLFDGDSVLIDRDKKPISYNTVLAYTNGDYLIRKFVRDGSRLELRALNSDYKKIDISDEKNILGVIINVSRKQ